MFKLPDRRVVLFSGVCLCVFIAVCALMLGSYPSDSVMIAGEEVSLIAKDEQDIAAFAGHFGYTADHAVTQEITLPASANEVYESYLLMQDAQGLTLRQCMGLPAKRLLCLQEDGETLLSLIVCREKIVAADITRGGKAEALFVSGE